MNKIVLTLKREDSSKKDGEGSKMDKVIPEAPAFSVVQSYHQDTHIG
jgi:hypothetical protein